MVRVNEKLRCACACALLNILIVFAGPSAAHAQATYEKLPRAATAIDTALAQALRGASSFGAVESAMGGPGARIGHSDESDGPHDVIAWTGRDGRGLARAFLFANGDFSVVLRPAGAQDDLVLNSFGAFVCPTCEPPVNACGRRPWWVPHDVHFDTFDCGCSLAGPQSVGVGTC
jgi:hypothetical protein